MEQVRGELARQAGVEWDEGGQIAGLGLTLRPMPHKFTFDGRTVFGWCAADALVFSVLVHRPSRRIGCPVTGRSIRAEVTPVAVLSVDLQEAAVSEVRLAERVATRTPLITVGYFTSEEFKPAERIPLDHIVHGDSW